MWLMNSQRNGTFLWQGRCWKEVLIQYNVLLLKNTNESDTVLSEEQRIAVENTAPPSLPPDLSFMPLCVCQFENCDCILTSFKSEL